MRKIRSYSAFFLLLVFLCYYSSIRFFSHVHIVNGNSIVHSHLGGGTDHDHSDSEYSVIDILSQFQSDNTVDYNHTEAPFFLLSEITIGDDQPTLVTAIFDCCTRRGPPQC